MSHDVLEAQDLGLLSYAQAAVLQDQLVLARQQQHISDRLLLLEHPRVFTYGKRAGTRHLLVTPSTLHDVGIELVETDRGGDITYHGPGQLVGYLIAQLHGAQQNVPWLFAAIEGAVVQTLAEFGVQALSGTPMPTIKNRGEVALTKAGVWVGQNKICALGMKLSAWTTKHGLALNVDPIMEDYQYVIACGLKQHGITSMREQGALDLEMKTIKLRLAGHIAAALERDLCWI